MNSSNVSEKHKHLIITAASAAFGSSLLALLGSINLNWQSHPPIKVYDLGLQTDILEALSKNHIPVTKVPPFCPHWRKHFTWKIWCLNNAPTEHVYWIDAGMLVIEPLDEILAITESLGYFFTTNNQLLDWEASEAACIGCGVEPAFRLGKLTLAGGIMGFRKKGIIHQLLQEALTIALDEKNIQATHHKHRHDQAIISLLAYKNIGPVLVADRHIYCQDKSPEEFPGQKVWVHRRGILPQDLEYYKAFVSQSGLPRKPLNPRKNRPKNPLTLSLRFIRSRTRRIIDQLTPPEIYDGIRDI